MIFKYQCFECNRVIATEDPCAMVICMFCMQEMKLIQVGQTKVTEDTVIQ